MFLFKQMPAVHNISAFKIRVADINRPNINNIFFFGVPQKHELG